MLPYTFGTIACRLWIDVIYLTSILIPTPSEQFHHRVKIMSADVEKSADSIRILLIDDMPFRRASIANLLDSWALGDGNELAIIETTCGENLVQHAQIVHLIIYNVGAGSVEAAECQHNIDHVRQDLPNVPLVIIAERDQASDVIEALRAGARGFISAQTPAPIVFQALKFIMRGGMYFPPSAMLQANFTPQTPMGRRPVTNDDVRQSTGLTSRQREVWQLLQHGYPNKVIARQLDMCESTVKVHMKQIMRKFGASNRTQAALCGGEVG